MGRPKGSLNKSYKEEPPFEIKVNPVRYDAIFGVRNLRNGNFKGLWELVKLDGNGNRTQVLTDANSRGMILTIINRHIMKIVVQS